VRTSVSTSTSPNSPRCPWKRTTSWIGRPIATSVSGTPSRSRKRRFHATHPPRGVDQHHALADLVEDQAQQRALRGDRALAFAQPGGVAQRDHRAAAGERAVVDADAAAVLQLDLERAAARAVQASHSAEAALGRGAVARDGAMQQPRPQDVLEGAADRIVAEAEPGPVGGVAERQGVVGIEDRDAPGHRVEGRGQERGLAGFGDRGRRRAVGRLTAWKSRSMAAQLRVVALNAGLPAARPHPR
jgi:hypothetical protein